MTEDSNLPRLLVYSEIREGKKYMDPISIKLAEASAEHALETSKNFLSKLLGPAIDELGLLLQDNVKVYRFKNLLRIMGEAQKMLLEAGYDPKAIPFRTLLPILEGASLEDSDILSYKWAALLANAASGLSKISTHPSFPRILSELTPDEAKLLDKLESVGKEAEWNSFRTTFAQNLNISEKDVNRYQGNLFRLGLARNIHKINSKVNIISISPFGDVFLLACKKPDKQ